MPIHTKKGEYSTLPQHLSEVSASLSPPLSGRSGGALGATLRDILTELEKPGREPRGEIEVFEFDKNVHTLSDLIIGMELPRYRDKHQHVRVCVVEVDMRRKRIALSLKNIKQ